MATEHQAPEELVERVQELLGSLDEIADPVAQQRVQELIGTVLELYGAGLERVLGIVDDAGDDALPIREALLDDGVVSSLLLIHGLYPISLEERVVEALDSVRPFLASHGGNVELLGVDDGGVVRLRLLGSCDGCPSSAVTLQLAVEGAVEDAAPEITGIEVETPTSARSAGLISIDSLRSRLGEPTPAGDVDWRDLPGAAEMRSGEIGGFNVEGVDVFVCAVDDDRFVYRDVCARCAGSLGGTALSWSDERVFVRCPTCGTAYDVRRAGTNVDGGPEHLDPLPVLMSGGEWRVALPAGVSA